MGRARNVVKKIAKRSYRAAKRRYAPKGVLSIKKIVKDVRSIQRQLNVEKKFINNQWATQFARLSGAGSGHNLFEITPQPTQGTSGGGAAFSACRIGNSIKVTGCMMNMRIQGQSLQVLECKFKLYVFRTKNGLASPTVGQILDPNIFIGTNIYDYYSLRNQEHLGNIKIVKTFYGKIKSDVDAGATTDKIIQCPLKLNHHMRYDTDASTTSTINRFYILCVADSGDQGANTGLDFSGQVKWWFVDN